MRSELVPIKAAIDTSSLPADFDSLLGQLWSKEQSKFHIQETFLLDYKIDVPKKLTDEFGSGIIRLCLAFHNTFGGIIIFGVRDKEMTLSGTSAVLDVENINRVLSDCSAFKAECVTKAYMVDTSVGTKTVQALLVPRRRTVPPVRLLRNFAKYPVGTLWIRDRAEVLEAKPRHLPLTYSDRTTLPSEAPDTRSLQVHRSLPPSPATLKTFIGRERLLLTLWDWLIFGDQPRLYLHGPGGSGKSTLAFEFARLLTDSDQQISFSDGSQLDYVIFISGKETELNPYNAREQPYLLQQFGNVNEQFGQIIYHSGMLSEDLLGKISSERVDVLLDELFNNFNGLIVIDDIDALHRKGLESGEETLLMKALLRRGKTKILYTLRFPPANASKSAQAVPGLEGDEFYAFAEACCQQFGVTPPDGQYYPTLMEITKSLPLVVETVILSRKDCGNYPDAFAMFASKGGDETRRYLYQREYDRLERTGKSRQVLASLLLFEEPLAFSTLCKLFQFPAEQVRDAVAECSSVFMSTLESVERGETLYQLTPPSVPFIQQVSQGLPYINRLRASVDHYKKVRKRASPDEAALIVSMEKFIRQGRHAEIVAIGKSLPADDPILVNPKIQSLLGQANAELGPSHREYARTFFRGAEGLNYVDVFMMRRWYNLEMVSGHGLVEAERICNVMLVESDLTSRVKSEFRSKLARSLFQQGVDLTFVSREKTINLLTRSIAEYFEALWIGEKGQDIDLSQTLGWLEKPLQKFMPLALEDSDHVFTFLEQLAEKRKDIHKTGIRLFFEYFLATSLDVRRPDLRNKLKGYCARAIRKVSQVQKSNPKLANYDIVLQQLSEMRAGLEILDSAAK